MVVLLLVGAAACAGPEAALRCGSGTEERNGECVASNAVASSQAADDSAVAGTSAPPSTRAMGATATSTSSSSPTEVTPTDCAAEGGFEFPDGFERTDGSRCVDGVWTPPRTTARPALGTLATTPPAFLPSPSEQPYPAGFERASLELAARWIASSDSDWPGCGYYDVCAVLQLYAIEGCPNGGYVEANVNNDGVIVDFRNDSIPTMTEGERYNSVLGGFGSIAGTVSLTELYCF